MVHLCAVYVGFCRPWVGPLGSSRFSRPYLFPPVFPPSLGPAHARNRVMRLRQKVAQAAVVAVLGASAVAYGALEKNVTVRVEGSLIRVHTFAGSVGDVLDRAHITVASKDLVRPAITTHLREGMLIEVRRAKPIMLLLNGQPRQVIVTGLNVEEVIEEMNLRGSLADFVGSSRSQRVTSGMVLVYRNAVGIVVVHDGATQRVITNAGSIRQVLLELGVKVGAKDIVQPSLDSAPGTGGVVRVLRVGTRIETLTRRIPFTTVAKKDPYMERGEHEIRQHGRSGLAQIRVRVTYKDGRAVKRVPLATRVIRSPTPKVLAVGVGPRCVCTRGSQTGDGTWYGAEGLIAAHPSLPFGTVVRVTNLENGMTVTVTIRDRGPTGEGRIIDLSDDAFRRIGSLSDGVVRVSIRW
jgi:resuscitation-promoting factor RpfB